MRAKLLTLVILFLATITVPAQSLKWRTKLPMEPGLYFPGEPPQSAGDRFGGSAWVYWLDKHSGSGATDPVARRIVWFDRNGKAIFTNDVPGIKVVTVTRFTSNELTVQIRDVNPSTATNLLRRITKVNTYVNEEGKAKLSSTFYINDVPLRLDDVIVPNCDPPTDTLGYTAHNRRDNTIARYTNR